MHHSSNLLLPCDLDFIVLSYSPLKQQQGTAVGLSSFVSFGFAMYFCLDYFHALDNAVCCHCQNRSALFLVMLSLGCFPADFLPLVSPSSSPAFLLSLMVPLVHASPIHFILFSLSFCFCSLAASLHWISAHSCLPPLPLKHEQEGGICCRQGG